MDFIVPKGRSAETQKFFESLGYAPQTRFNTLYGTERLLFFDEDHDRQVDILVGTFRMCHEIPIGKRLDLEPMTIPLAELLLTKLQIIELNEKDVRDSLALLHNHPVEESDGDSVNAAHVAKLCASDWGLWRTITANLEALGGHIDRYDIDDEGKGRIDRRHREVAGAHRRGAQALRVEDAREDRGQKALVRPARGSRGGTMISRLFNRGPDTRIFFATDIHGSETCWKKFLNSGKHYEAKVIVLGGDMTGKALVPIVESGKGNWHATLLENRRDFDERGRGKGVRGLRQAARLLPVPHHPGRDVPSSRPTRSCATSTSTRRCSAPSSAGCGWPRRSWPAPASSATSAPATTTSSRWTRSSRTRRASTSPRAGSSSSATSRWSRPAGPTAPRGTPTGKRTSPTSRRGSKR